MISGVHTILYSADAEADKAFFEQVLKLSNINIGHGWLIFALPPSELAVHPAEENTGSELYLMCDDIHVFVKEMAAQHISCSAIQEQRWGLLVQLALPGGAHIGVYQALHGRPF